MVCGSRSVSADILSSVDGNPEPAFSHRRSILNYQMATGTVRRIFVAAVCALRDPLIFGSSTALLWNVKIDSSNESSGKAAGEDSSNRE